MVIWNGMDLIGALIVLAAVSMVVAAHLTDLLLSALETRKSWRRGKYVLFWDFQQEWTWGPAPLDPFLPYEWRIFLGPFCLCEVTTNKPRRLSRQERRALQRRLDKEAAALVKAGWRR
jgi:hypothetical protein